MNDLWALIAFIATGITANGIIFIKKNVNVKYSLDYINHRLLGISLSFLLGYSLLLMLGFFFIPSIFMHLGFILSIVIPIVFAVAVGNFIFLFFGLLSSALMGFFYFYYGIKFIPFSSKVLKNAVGVVFRHAHYVFGAIILLYLGISAQVILPMHVISRLDSVTNVFCVFYLYWALSVSTYCLIVFVASVISIYLFNNGHRGLRLFGTSLKNTALSAGTICFGALLVAVVQTLRYIVRMAENRRREEDRNIFFLILAFIANLILSIMEDILTMMNEWVFVYVAIYGKNYMNSIYGSFDIAVRRENTMLISDLIVDKAIYAINLVGYMAYGSLIYSTFGFKNITERELINIIVFSVLVIFYIFLVSGMILAACKTVMFVYAEKPDCVAAAMPEVDEAIKKIKYGEVS